jgi:hypothetical protein
MWKTNVKTWFAISIIRPAIVSAIALLYAAQSNMAWGELSPWQYKTAFYNVSAQATDVVPARLPNGDDKPDLVVKCSHGYHLMMSTPSGQFNVSKYWGFSDGSGGWYDPIDILTADLDSDGYSEVVYATRDRVFVCEYYKNSNTGDEFLIKKYITGWQDKNIVSMTTGDFNGDGLIDVAVAFVDGIRLLYQGGDHYLTFGPWYNDVAAFSSLCSSDFNSDGKADIAGIRDGKVSVLCSQPGGGFGGRQDFLGNPLSGVGKVVCGDFNGDGHPDLAASYGSSPSRPEPWRDDAVSVFLGLGGGIFKSRIDYFPGDYLEHLNKIASGDLNCDGCDDLLVNQTCVTPYHLYCLYGQPDGSMIRGSVETLGGLYGWPDAWLSTGKFDSDDHIDLIIMKSDNPTLEIRFNSYVEPHLQLSHAPYLFKAEPTAIGEWSGVGKGADPLYEIDPRYPPNINRSTYGNNLETQYGWVRVEERTGFYNDPREFFKGQWSRMAADIGTEVRLFGESIYGSNSYKERSLETTSLASFDISGLEPQGTVQLKVNLDYDTRIDGTAFWDNASFVINEVIPAAVTIGKNFAAKTTMKIAKNTGKYVFEKLSDTGINYVAEESRFNAWTSFSVLIDQETDIPQSVVLSPMTGFTSKNGGVTKDYQVRKSESATVTIDPDKRVYVGFVAGTEAYTLGFAQAYAGITHYRLQFDLVGVDCPPLVFEQWDPTPQTDDAGAYYKDLLLVTVNTPELVTGSVEVLDSIGTFSPKTGNKLVKVSNSEMSGFLLPMKVSGDTTGLNLYMGAMVSDTTLTNKAAIQIVFIQDEQLYDIADVNLCNIFTFDANSGVVETPYAAHISPISFGLKNIPRGEGTFLIAFGNLEESDLRASLIIDSISLASDKVKGDFNFDNLINFADVVLFVSRWLERDCNDPSWCSGTDIDRSGGVDFSDFAILCENWHWTKNPADLDGDGDVDYADLRLLTNFWLRSDANLDIVSSDGGIISFLDFAEFAQHWLEGTNH